MGCAITAGYLEPNCITVTVGTSRTDIWLFNTDEIASYTETVPGEIDAFTMDTTANYNYKLSIKKKSGRLYQEKQEDDGGGISYTQGFEFTIASSDTAARNFVDSLNGVNLTVVVRRSDDTFDVIGLDEGVSLMTMTESTASGELGYNCGLVGEEFSYVTKKFYDTDLATTITTLDTPSDMKRI